MDDATGQPMHGFCFKKKTAMTKMDMVNPISVSWDLAMGMWGVLSYP